MTSDRRLGWLAILAGASLALAIQIAAPVGVPLYDGVVVQEPYRYLHPTGDQVNSPTSFSSAPAVGGGVSPLFAASTNESPPQAQLNAQKDAFEIPAGTTSLKVSISPIEPPPAPPSGSIEGNVYRFSVTDQAGTPLTIKPCQGCISLTLRAPDDVGEATIKRFADGAWSDVEAIHSLGMYQTNPTALGDYAVITIAGEESGLDPILILGGAALVLLLAGGALLYFRVRPAPAVPIDRGRGSVPRRVPSKRRAPKGPPSGRSDQ